MRKDVRLLSDEVVFSNLTDRQVTQPQGLFGGQGGPVGSTTRNPDSPDPEPLHSKGSYRLSRNDVVSTTLSGSGGCGSPETRDPQAVLRDVRDDYVSIDAARNVYKVAINPDTMSIDSSETRLLRGNKEQHD